MSVRILPGVKLTPVVLAAQAAEIAREDDLVGLFLVVLRKDSSAAHWSNMTAGEVSMAALVALDAANEVLRGEHGFEGEKNEKS